MKAFYSLAIRQLIMFAILLLFFLSDVRAQSLGYDRVVHLKKSTVRILINGHASGTGFIVSDQGMVITCFHVIEPALRLGVKTEAEFPSGEKVELNVFNYFLQSGVREALGDDCCLLIFAKKPQTQFEYLNVGSFNDVQEGDQIYTIGYPLSIKQPFISMGILSTKWIQSNHFTYMSKVDSLDRDVAWIDVTMNRGNSGGPVIKIGSTLAEDKVIGISTFILNPYGPVAEQLATSISTSNMDMLINGISQNKVTQLFAEAIANNSIGVSGCISIDHIKTIARQGKIIK